MAETIEFPGMTPDYLADEDDGRRGEHDMGWVHVSLLRGYAGDCAVFALKTEEPSERALWQRRERWFDEIANVIQQFCPAGRTCIGCHQVFGDDGVCACMQPSRSTGESNG